MDLNWCPVCEQHIPLAWESSLYCSDRCKKADALATHPGLGYSYPADLQSFPHRKNSIYSPLSSPTLTSVNSSSSSSSSTINNNTYPSPPTSPMTNYIYNKTTTSGRISPPSFSLGHPANDYLEMRRKSTGPQYTMSTSTTTSVTANAKKGFFW
ncbi:hypothetical protein CPC16_003398 [Podila verticillata]|nr:hypothetical protein BGZ52_000165 [Haplosporangium bisporale]KAF9214535.1 hypothetical protein BGZ59_003498 [Podila verticillata]KAF9370923.1 hypothetical protein CPC16_003398 [Podila verticillata]KAI9233171.1 MAG: hypothetical protein BYD32DRAFT_426622 [Podila humilis]KFH67745.1 hypothetical protein MVEG_06477 [Podila verticillata NRRL 6337]